MFTKIIDILSAFALGILVFAGAVTILTGCVQGYNITTDAGYDFISYNITPNAPINQSVYFDNVIIPYHISTGFITGSLEEGTTHTLTIVNTDTGETQTTTTTTKEKAFYAKYGIIGLFILISLMIYLSTKIPYIGYASMALSIIGLLYVMKNTNEFIEILIFAVLMLTSILTIRSE